MSPRRIQRKRTKGWRMPENAVYVGRPTAFGNPYTLKGYRFVDVQGAPINRPDDARIMALRDFEMWLHCTPNGAAYMERAKSTLRGKDLACWCPLDQPCHADVLLEIANA